MRGFNRCTGFILALLFTALVACSQPAEEIEFVTPSKDEMFLDIVRDQYPILESAADSDLIGLAKASCGVLDNGGTKSDLFDISYNSGMDIEMAGFIIGSGIGTYCPEHTDSP